MKAKQLPSGSWRVQVQKDGKRYSFTSKDKETAKENARTFLKVKADVTAMPLGDAIDSYIELKRNVLSPSTIKGYENIIDNHLNSLLLIWLDRLTEKHLQDAFDEEIAKAIIMAGCAVGAGLSLFLLSLPSMPSSAQSEGSYKRGATQLDINRTPNPRH